MNFMALISESSELRASALVEESILALATEASICGTMDSS